MLTSPGAAEAAGAELLFRGAEADIMKGNWQGMEAVFKVRKPLAYRLPELDDAIRRQRTIREAEMIHRSKKAGVSAPFLYDVDVPGTTLVMEFVSGTRLRDLALSSYSSLTIDAFRELGRGAAKLHSAGIAHGDLTTANVVVRKGELVFIDFGLAFPASRLEDHAVDLRLIKETVTGAHPSVSRAALEELFKGYSDVVGERKQRDVLRQLRSIERRGRYARVS